MRAGRDETGQFAVRRYFAEGCDRQQKGSAEHTTRTLPA
jgi:hypothetical protein